MNETAPPDPPPTPPTLVLRPLPAESLSPAVQKVLGGATPGKLMALKGIAPLRPAELLTTIYQLTFDADAAVKSAAEGAPAALPDKLLLAPLGEALPAPVLHLFALRLPPARGEAIEKLLFNLATADESFVALAARLGERELEIICQNETRLLRCPAIVQALYCNPQTRASSVNRAIELCVRNGVRVDGIPAYDDVARAITDDAQATTPAVDAALAEVLAASDRMAARTGDVPPPTATPPEGVPQPVAETRTAALLDFSKLKLWQKLRLATVGNAHCRQRLLQDPNRLVALSAIQSPNITESEVVQAAASRAVNEDVIRYIAGQREYLKLYAVKHNLVHNPKCPIALSTRLLSTLNGEDIKAIARSKNVPGALSVAAKRLAQARGLAVK